MNSSRASVSGAIDAAVVADIADRVLEVVPRAMRRIREQMRAGASGLTVAQLRALLFIRRHPGTSLSALTDHLGISVPAGSALVDRLVLAGQVDRVTDPAERRRIRLDLTGTGAEQVGRAQVAARAWLHGELHRRSAVELEQLMDALAILDSLGAGDPGPATPRGDR